MLDPDFFEDIGMFVIKDFLSIEVCQRLIAEMRSSRQDQASIYRSDTKTREVNIDIRNTIEVKVSASTRLYVKELLLSLRQSLQSFFEMEIDFRQIDFYIYREGSFFMPHQDVGALDEPEGLRKLNVIIFLNGQSEEPGSSGYQGGSLVFYNVLDDPYFKGYGFPLAAQPGLLISFPSDTLHEVTPVTAGVRYAIVALF
jgi:predicted 2-oxoglutarate/Fe(II)-dependent dioxygenase YbiX